MERKDNGAERTQSSRIRSVEIKNGMGLTLVEKKYRRYAENEIIPYAKVTPYLELAETVIPDKDGLWKHPLYLYTTIHTTTIGVSVLCHKVKEFLGSMPLTTDILSITAGMDGDHLRCIMLFRVYDELPEGDKPDISELYTYLGERRTVRQAVRGARLLIPESAVLKYTEDELRLHKEDLIKQNEVYAESTDDEPYLNRLDHYVMRTMPEIDDSKEFVYDLLTRDMQTATILSYEQFIRIFQQCMSYVSGIEKDTYYAVVRGTISRDKFDAVMEDYIDRNFVAKHLLPLEDKPALLRKLDRALFELYIVQDLIDDPAITDIKITSPDTIRVRVGGKAYLSNVRFVSTEDYIRFVNSIAVKNNIDLKLPSQTFTDEHDSEYILRFLINSPYIMANGLPSIHIRKVPRKKLMADDLIEAGMFDAKIRDYLIDRGRDRDSMGIVFAGPPGSGKTVMLNWFLEDAYEQSAEILVIQENDELFAYRKGVLFEHVVNNPQKGEKPCSLEDLGQLALVAGANVFIIGEAKGAEICSAITLSNSGCRTAITLHSPSSRQTIDKMADLAMRGYAQSYEQAMRMITSFKTIVYLQDFKVAEISEVIGWDDEKGIPKYKLVYRRQKGDKT